MKSMTALALATIFSLAVLAGCSQEARDKFDKDFRTGWRSSFIESCSGEAPGAEQTALCTCVADKALANMTTKELMDIDGATKRITNDFVPQCQAE